MLLYFDVFLGGIEYFIGPIFQLIDFFIFYKTIKSWWFEMIDNEMSIGFIVNQYLSLVANWLIGGLAAIEWYLNASLIDGF